jgi:hypothetical protein
MPDEETALHYFDLFFSNIHPYVPVLDRSAFYRQWQTNRDSISPLVLEAVFALAGRIADEPGEGQQWLALATRHADSFRDTPRLSTIQALLLILKAREAAPRRGYFYRSWMAIVQCVQMGKELGLDEHFEDHKAGRSCDSSAADCALKSRIWQTVFVCETMIGSAQGMLASSRKVDSNHTNVANQAARISLWISTRLTLDCHAHWQGVMIRITRSLETSHTWLVLFAILRG